MTPDTMDAHPARGVSVIALLAGLWLFASGWVYGANGNFHAWNSWIVGALIFVFGLIRASHPSQTRLAWLNSILGLWTIASAWVYSSGEPAGNVINSLCVGLIVFCAAIIGANSERMNHDHTSVNS